MNITVRRARPEEAEALTELSMRSKQSNGYDDDFMDKCREELTVTKERLEGGEYWVAETDALCGCVCLGSINAGSGEVHAFFIEPDHQRKGIGHALWNKVLERAHTLKLTELFLDADPSAVPFYEKIGFTIISQVPSGSIPGRTLPKMRLSLG